MSVLLLGKSKDNKVHSKYSESRFNPMKLTICGNILVMRISYVIKLT